MKYTIEKKTSKTYGSEGSVLGVCFDEDAIGHLLTSIAKNFGFNDQESKAIVEKACINSQPFSHSLLNSDTRIQLTRTIVRLCVFKVSSKIFSHEDQRSLYNKGLGSGSYPLKTGMPLSFQTVYILFHTARFTEKEIAQILNITSLQVKERLSKAEKFIRGY